MMLVEIAVVAIESLEALVALLLADGILVLQVHAHGLCWMLVVPHVEIA